MPSFARRNGLYGTQIITGPRSVLLRLALGPERVEFPVLVVLRPDARFGDPVPEAVRTAVLAGAAEANAALGTALHPQRLEYAADNDGQCTLLRRAALAIVTRLAERGEEGYDGHDDQG
jgi:hypothetical protein